MRRLDSHVHISLNAESSTLADGELLCRLLDEVEQLNILNIVLEKPENLPRNAISLLLKLRFPGRVYSFGGIVMPRGRGREEDYVRQVELLGRAGFDGVKLFGKPSVRASRPIPFDDPVYDGMYGTLQNSGTPVNFHIGDPPEFWDRDRVPAFAWKNGWYYGEGEYPSMETLLGEIVHVLEKFPRLKLLVPHMMFLSQDLERLRGLLERFPTLLTDITPGRELYFQLSENREKARAFFLRYHGRILFGTDNAVCVQRKDSLEQCRETLSAVERFLETEDRFQAWGGELAGLGLPGEVLGDLYGDNFRRWVGEEPARPQGGSAMEYCGWLRELAARQGCAPAERELTLVMEKMAELAGTE